MPDLAAPYEPTVKAKAYFRALAKFGQRLLVSKTLRRHCKNLSQSGARVKNGVKYLLNQLDPVSESKPKTWLPTKTKAKAKSTATLVVLVKTSPRNPSEKETAPKGAEKTAERYAIVGFKPSFKDVTILWTT
mmetsp:Transcript_17172/g.25426  ORF Transcript_17172/g.25426 Transcript_17172/m.25426 type:complete len:132 (+) Transcript_17172:735-1130(+)